MKKNLGQGTVNVVIYEKTCLLEIGLLYITLTKCMPCVQNQKRRKREREKKNTNY